MSPTSSPVTLEERRPGLARNILHLGIGQVATTALTMVLNAVIARTIGAAEYGLMYLLISIANFAYVFVDWGHGTYVPREVARHPERSGELLGSVLVVRAITAVVAGALAVALTAILGFDARTRYLTALTVTCWLPVYLGLTYTWIFRGRERMEFDALLNTVLKGTLLTVSLLALWRGARLFALMAAWGVAGMVTAAIAVTIYRRLDLPPLRVSRDTARELIVDGAPMLAIALAIAVQPYIDANILYKLVPHAVVGWYGATWIIAGTLVAPASILGATMFPRLSRAWDVPDEFTRTLRLSFRPLLTVAMLGAVGTWLFAPFAIGVAYGSKNFGPAGDILRAFAPALALIYIDMLLGHAILAAGKATRLAKAKIGAVCVTTAAELILIPWTQRRLGNGGIGIMLALATGELVMVCASVVLIRRYMPRGMAVDLLRAAAAGAATIAAMSALPQLHPGLAIPLCVSLFLSLCAVLGLIGRDELQLLVSAVKPKRPDRHHTTA